MSNKIETCNKCGVEVVFESFKDSPPEYDCCDTCDGKFCPGCFGGFEGECKACRGKENITTEYIDSIAEALKERLCETSDPKMRQDWELAALDCLQEMLEPWWEKVA